MSSDPHVPQPQPSPPRPAEQPAEAPLPPRLLRTADLFAGDSEILIEHHGEIYKMRITARGRLILQK